MKDSVKIKATNGGSHFEIKRELSETVSYTDLQNRLDSINGEIEIMEEQLTKLEKNKQIIVDALKSGRGAGTTNTDTKLV